VFSVVPAETDMKDIGMALSWRHIPNQMLIKYIKIRPNVHAAPIHLSRGSAVAGASQG
jgi:hypothetical protein